MRVLLIEDNADLAASIGDYLEAQHHSVDFAYDATAGLEAARRGAADVIILDRVLPGFDGAHLCRQLRDAHGIDTPVLMLTAMDALADRVGGLQAGADDYLVKPFAMAELEARLHALHRRASGSLTTGTLKLADLEYDTRTLEVHRAGVRLQLNRTTRRILEFLLRQHGRTVTRAELEYLLWRDEVPDGDVLRAHLHALRLVIDRPFAVKLLHTVRGSGYRLSECGEPGDG